MRPLLAILLLFFCCSLLSPAVANDRRAVLGSPAPALELDDFLTGQAISLSSQAAQKPVILLFLTSWSKSGQNAFKELAELSREQKGRFALVAVFYDKKSGELKDFLSGQKIDFPVLLDRKLSSVSRWQVLILPTIYCLDKGGTVRNIFVNYDDNVKKAVSDWLGS